MPTSHWSVLTVLAAGGVCLGSLILVTLLGLCLRLRRWRARTTMMVLMVLCILGPSIANGATLVDVDSGTTSDLNGVWMTSDGSFGVAVGDAGTIVMFDGSSWSLSNSGTTADLYDVHGLSKNDVVVSGHAIILRWDGAVWTGAWEAIFGDRHASPILLTENGVDIWFGLSDSPPSRVAGLGKPTEGQPRVLRSEIGDIWGILGFVEAICDSLGGNVAILDKFGRGFRGEPGPTLSILWSDEVPGGCNVGSFPDMSPSCTDPVCANPQGDLYRRSNDRWNFLDAVLLPGNLVTLKGLDLVLDNIVVVGQGGDGFGAAAHFDGEEVSELTLMLLGYLNDVELFEPNIGKVATATSLVVVAVGDDGRLVSGTVGIGPTIFVDGFESGDTSAWSNTVP